MVNNPSIRPYFLGVCGIAGVLLNSYEDMLPKSTVKKHATQNILNAPGSRGEKNMFFSPQMPK